MLRKYNIGDSKHPQSDIINRHVERAVNDIFVNSIVNKSPYLLRIFLTEHQLESFIEKSITFCESKELYEKCSLINEHREDFKSAWLNIDCSELKGPSGKIEDLFKNI